VASAQPTFCLPDASRYSSASARKPGDPPRVYHSPARRSRRPYAASGGRRSPVTMQVKTGPESVPGIVPRLEWLIVPVPWHAAGRGVPADSREQRWLTLSRWSVENQLKARMLVSEDSSSTRWDILRISPKGSWRLFV
jgi:hypothetical protein